MRNQTNFEQVVLEQQATNPTILDRLNEERQPPQIGPGRDYLSIEQQFLRSLEMETLELDAVLKDLDEIHELSVPSMKLNDEIARNQNTLGLPDKLESRLFSLNRENV